jgi:hypothetical protein
MNRRKFLQNAGIAIAGVGLMDSTNASKIDSNFAHEKNITVIKARNKTEEVVSISLPVQKCLGSESIVEVDVKCGNDTKTLKLDAYKEDFSIRFPDDSVWRSNRGKPYMTIG